VNDVGDVVLTDIDERIAVVTINRPEARNALNRAVQERLPEVLAALDADDHVDVVILTGADPAFSAGVDLKELAAGDRELVLPRHERGLLPPRTKPLIGAINGAAVTGALELALACDFLVASERARFADTHARVGVQPSWGLTVLLPAAVGVRRARQMSLTGNYVDAATALAWGLVNVVVPHDDLLPTARRLATDITSVDQPAARRLLRTYAETTAATTDEGWAVERAVAEEWAKAGLDTDEIARRRAAITNRGRSQV
jgi:enoyl-CoA hydratase